jgi:hypothetical protein
MVTSGTEQPGRSGTPSQADSGLHTMSGDAARRAVRPGRRPVQRLASQIDNLSQTAAINFGAGHIGQRSRISTPRVCARVGSITFGPVRCVRSEVSQSRVRATEDRWIMASGLRCHSRSPGCSRPS